MAFPFSAPWGPQLPLPLNGQTTSRETAGPKAGGSLVTLPRFVFLWDFLPGPSELVLHFKAKQNDGLTYF